MESKRKRAQASATNKNTTLLHNAKKKDRPSELHVISDVQVIKSDAPTDHYLLKELKSSDDSDIDFVLSELQFQDESSRLPPTECREEIHIDEPLNADEIKNEYPHGDAHVDTQEIVEHVCGMCFLTFRSIQVLKRHMDYCIFNNESEHRKAEMLKNIEVIEKEAIIMEKKDICFCCGDSYDTCHLGHINCPHCPKTFKTQLSLERHVCLIHSEEDNFACTVCNGRIRTKALLDLHITQHLGRGKPYACKACGKDFTRPYHLKRHLKFSSCGDGTTEIMRCKVCGKEFFRVDNLRVHLRTHLGHGTPKKPEYMCPSCKKFFYSLSTLNIHIRTHTGERPFDCDICDKKFPSLVALKKHRRYHTGEKPYTCSVCSQSFAVKEVLNRHMKRHTGEKPHSCSICEKRFIQATQLKNHLRTHIRKYECDKCPEKFKTEKQLLNHLKKEHNDKPKLWCEDCSLSFTSRKYLEKHKKGAAHLAIRQTNCSICGATFQGLKALEFHMLKGHDNAEIKCDQCDMVFGQLTLWRHHMQTIHVTQHNPKKEQAAQIESPKPSEIQTSKNEEDKGGVVIEEFIITSFESEKDAKARIGDGFTVVAKNNEVTHELEKIKKKPKLSSPQIRAQLKKSLVACLNQKKAKEETMNENDIQITQNVGKLLDMLVDTETLEKFGWPKDTVEIVLCKVIENCGHKLRKANFAEEYGERMREYVKLLFTVVIQNDSIKELLNNYSIDEVIEFVLSNEDEVI